MLCLLIETTSPKGSLGLCSLSSEAGDTLPIVIKEWSGSSHSASITLAFESLFKNPEEWGSEGRPSPGFSSKGTISSKLALNKKNLNKNLSFLALGVGPGRFTGVRVGVSFAKTLSYILHTPIYPVSSLKILAESQVEQEKPILVLVNAFKNSLYMALYQKKESKLAELIPPSVVLPQDLSKKVQPECVCVGDGYAAYEAAWPLDFKKKIQVKENIFPEVKYFPSLLQREFDSSQLIQWEELKPVYLRSPVQVIK